MPDEVSEEICPQCGRNLVIKSGRFGRFLACPGWPECDFTMPLVVEMPGKCPKCGGRLLKRTGTSKKTNKQYTYYCCEHLNSKDETAKVRLYDLGCAGEGQLPGVRPDHVQKVRPGLQEALLHQSRVLQLPAGGPERLSQESLRRRARAKRLKPERRKPSRRQENPQPRRLHRKKTTAKKPAAKKTTAKTATKKPAAKKTTAKSLRRK